jgi:hypothetical protein
MNRTASTVTDLPGARIQRRGDSAGIMLSGVCLLHCLAAPAIAAVIPALAFAGGHQWDYAVHWSLLLVAAPVSAWTLRQGRKSHGRNRWVVLGAMGLLLMLSGVVLHTPAHTERWLTVAGVLVLAAAHVLNWLAAARCGAPAPAAAHDSSGALTARPGTGQRTRHADARAAA